MATTAQLLSWGRTPTSPSLRWSCLCPEERGLEPPTPDPPHQQQRVLVGSGWFHSRGCASSRLALRACPSLPVLAQDLPAGQQLCWTAGDSLPHGDRGVGRGRVAALSPAATASRSPVYQTRAPAAALEWATRPARGSPGAQDCRWGDRKLGRLGAPIHPAVLCVVDLW